MLGSALRPREDLPQLVALLGVLFSQEAEFAPDARSRRVP